MFAGGRQSFVRQVMFIISPSPTAIRGEYVHNYHTCRYRNCKVENEQTNVLIDLTSQN